MIEPLDFAVSAESATDNPYMDTAGAADPDRALEQYIKPVGHDSGAEEFR